jgi:hypothetical protein
MKLDINENYQTKSDGTLDDKYQVYLVIAKQLGWIIKSYDEWLNS